MNNTSKTYTWKWRDGKSTFSSEFTKFEAPVFNPLSFYKGVKSFLQMAAIVVIWTQLPQCNLMKSLMITPFLLPQISFEFNFNREGTEE